MSTSPDGVGYKRPPRRSRWKKGQSGNPHGHRKKREANTLQIIDALLAKKVTGIGKNAAGRFTALQAIVLQLWAKALAGDSKASSVLLQYLETDPEIDSRPGWIVGGLPDRLDNEVR